VEVAVLTFGGSRFHVVAAVTVNAWSDVMVSAEASSNRPVYEAPT